MAIVKYIKVNI